MTKEDILSRRNERMKSIIVSKIDAKSESNNAFITFLEPLEAMEMVKKISYEMYFMQTGIKADLRVNKNIINILKRNL